MAGLHNNQALLVGGGIVDRLRASFIAGPASGVTAQEVFANRIGEVVAFRTSLRRMAELQAGSSSGPSSDIKAPRTNVLVYYGMGGVGKTALSRQLERTLLAGGSFPELSSRRAATRIDFGEAGEFDIESAMLQIRAMLKSIKPTWPAFDTAFMLYWARCHPGESMPNFIGQSPWLRQRAESLGLSDQLQDTLCIIFGELGLSWTPARLIYRLTSLTHDQLNASRTYRRLVRNCPFFEPIVTAEDPKEALSYSASLLAWELDREFSQNARPVVVFIDTFEAISEHENCQHRRYIQRIIYLMPTVLFVITSRNRIDWAETTHSGELDYIGPRRWPQLHCDNPILEPRQHLVGALSEADCEAYLSQALLSEGQPALSPEIRRRIIEGSAGLPLYLDLSVAQYLEYQALGLAINPEAFGGPLASVLVRIMRGFNREQRNLLRATSVLDSFDISLARAGSGSPDSTISRFVNSSLVAHTDGLLWPYTLHAILRRTIQETDDRLRDAWSPEEWEQAAQRILDHLASVTDAAKSARNRPLIAACFNQAIRLAVRFDLVPEWLLDSAQYLADVGQWRDLELRQTLSVAEGTRVWPLIEGLSALVQRRTGSLSESVEAFDRALAAPRIETGTGELLRLHRAHSRRNSGDYDGAQREYEDIASAGGTYTSRARLQLADLRLLRGDFQTALQNAEIEADDAEPDAVGEALRVKGHVYRFNAMFDEAEAVYKSTLELSRSIKSPALEGKARTNLAETLCWSGSSAARRAADEAIEFNENLGNQPEVLKAYVAKAVALGGSEGAPAVQRALALADTSGYRAGKVFALSADLFNQLILPHTPSRLQSIVDEVFSITEAINVYHYFNDIIGWWLAAASLHVPTPGHDTTQAHWLTTEEQASSRWASVLARRRQVPLG